MRDKYTKIISDNEHLIQDIEWGEVINWLNQDEIPEIFIQIFMREHQDTFKKEYSGYIADNNFESILATRNMRMSEPLRSQVYSIEKMSFEDLYDAISSNAIPLIHLDDKKGYQSTLNYLMTLPQKDKLSDDLLKKATEDKRKYNAAMLSFLSRSNLSDQDKQRIVVKIRDKDITLGDLAILSENELNILIDGSWGSIKYDLDVNERLLALFVLKDCFDVKDFQYFLNIAAKIGDLEVVIKLLEKVSQEDAKDLLKIHDNDGRTPLHIAVFNGHHEIVKNIVSAIMSEGIERHLKEHIFAGVSSELRELPYMAYLVSTVTSFASSVKNLLGYTSDNLSNADRVKVNDEVKKILERINDRAAPSR